MQVIHLVAVLGCLVGNALAGYTQFFYRGAVPVQPQSFYPRSFHQVFLPQPAITYSALPQYVQPQPFAYHHPVPSLRLLPVQDNRNAPIRAAEPPQAPQENTYNFVNKEADQFRGFAYHTEFDHGARSDVVFITGPEAHSFPASRRPQPLNPHTTASDAVDSNAIKEDTESIAVELPRSIQQLVDFFQNPEVGVRKFYSVDNALVARKPEDYLSFPANTAPITTTPSPIFDALRSNFNTEQPATQEPEGSASETKVKTVAPTTTTTTTAAPTTSAATSTTTTTTTTTQAPKTTMGTIVVPDMDEDNKTEQPKTES